MDNEREIFQNGSTTYYISSRFFPKNVRNDVFKLYSFVRVADDYVDRQPAKPAKLKGLEKRFKKALKVENFKTESYDDDSTDTRVIKNILYLTRKYDFNPEWIYSFFGSMKQDIEPEAYKTLQDSLDYVYGSAEVIGMMMARIMGAGKFKNGLEADPEKVMQTARMQGRAMQWINFVRDIEEDNNLGRCYFPEEDLNKFELPDISRSSALEKEAQFIRFVRYEIGRYREWQELAMNGHAYLPRRVRIPVKTSVDMYNWTADEIDDDPLIVFQSKVKPKKRQVILRAFRNAITV